MEGWGLASCSPGIVKCRCASTAVRPWVQWPCRSQKSLFPSTITPSSGSYNLSPVPSLMSLCLEQGETGVPFKAAYSTGLYSEHFACYMSFHCLLQAEASLTKSESSTNLYKHKYSEGSLTARPFVQMTVLGSPSRPEITLDIGF